MGWLRTEDYICDALRARRRWAGAKGNLIDMFNITNGATVGASVHSAASLSATCQWWHASDTGRTTMVCGCLELGWLRTKDFICTTLQAQRRWAVAKAGLIDLVI